MNYYNCTETSPTNIIAIYIIYLVFVEEEEKI